MNLKRLYNLFIKNGYCIIDLLNKNEINFLIRKIENKLQFIAKNNKNILKKITNKKIENYHNFGLDDFEHELLMNSYTRHILLDKKIRKKLHSKEIKYILNKAWSHNQFRPLTILGEERLVKYNFATFRIARPSKIFKKDVSGIHVDGNYDGQIRNSYNNLATIWIPLKGFSTNYTLNIAPKSHTMDHRKKIYKNKKIKTLQPDLKNSYKNKFKFIRPKLKIGQGIIFHSNLLHGGSYNNGQYTRVSLDFRFINLREFII